MIEDSRPGDFALDLLDFGRFRFNSFRAHFGTFAFSFRSSSMILSIDLSFFGDLDFDLD